MIRETARDVFLLMIGVPIVLGSLIVGVFRGNG